MLEKYKNWSVEHSIKHKKIVEKLSHLSDDEIIAYFDYENMKEKEVDFCPLYAQNKKCHDIENLNCYLCACPNFRVTTTKSFCNVNSKYGSSITTKDGYIHQNCSKCAIPHGSIYIKAKFSIDWKSIMKNCFSS